MTEPISRRGFLSTGAVLTGTAALTAKRYARVWGANDRVGVGFIGYGLIGKRHVLDFQRQPDADLLAVAEVHRGRMKEARALLGEGSKGYGDFRKLLDDKDIDAVVVSTPDHWHALQTMLACAAGKDVYVEKPLTLFVREGRWMIDVAARTKRVVQVGTQQRSGKHYQRAREFLRDGGLGKVVSVKGRAARNIMPGYGSPADGEPPGDLDYDLWLGPAPKRRYNPNRAIYHFRWFWDYSGGQMTNLGQHVFDVVDWIVGVGLLKSVTSVGGRFALTDDNGETPDTQDVLFDFGTWSATWSHREASRGDRPSHPLEFFGTNGSLGISRGGFEVKGDLLIPPPNTVPQFTGAHPVGGPQPVKQAKGERFRTKSFADGSGNSREQLAAHVRNFLDCVKSRKTPVSDLESGHRVATLCHLANISLRLGRTVRWDADKETIPDDAEAQKMLERPYRAPWDRERKALGIGG